MGTSKYEPLSYYDMQVGDFTNVNILIKEAKASNMWIYSGKWFSPEEFEELYKAEDSLTNKQIDTLLAHAKIRDPRAGITAAHKQLDELLTKYQTETEDLRNRIAEFNKRVIEYYQKKSLGRKPKLL